MSNKKSEIDTTSGEALEPSTLSQLEIMTELTNDPINLVKNFASSGVGWLAAIGIAATNPKQMIVSGSRVIQGSIKGSFIKSVGEEIIRLGNENKIDVNFINSEHFLRSFDELLHALENEDISPERLEFIRKIFLGGAMGAGAKNSLLTNRLLHIAGQLNVDEILLIQEIYKPNSVLPMVEEQRFEETSLIEILIGATGIPFTEDCDKAIRGLSEKNLLGTLSASHTSGGKIWTFIPTLRSARGQALYDFIPYYEVRK